MLWTTRQWWMHTYKIKATSKETKKLGELVALPWMGCENLEQSLSLELIFSLKSGLLPYKVLFSLNSIYCYNDTIIIQI